MFVVKSTICNMSQLIDLNKLPWDLSKSCRLEILFKKITNNILLVKWNLTFQSVQMEHIYQNCWTIHTRVLWKANGEHLP
uniref:Uncharacterized protein n=1 Tax=Triticum urartu TaxID=4572 RepID=A0A8R7R261_TRIUA